MICLARWPCFSSQPQGWQPFDSTYRFLSALVLDGKSWNRWFWNSVGGGGPIWRALCLVFLIWLPPFSWDSFCFIHMLVLSGDQLFLAIPPFPACLGTELWLLILRQISPAVHCPLSPHGLSYPDACPPPPIILSPLVTLACGFPLGRQGAPSERARALKSKGLGSKESDFWAQRIS